MTAQEHRETKTSNHIVEVSEELPELERKPFTDVEAKIGLHVAELVQDGATLQLGIGGIPNAVLDSLGGRKDLGVHTERVSDGIVKPIDAGIINNATTNLR